VNGLRDQIDLLPAYLGGHLVLSFSALATGALLSAILTLIALRWRPIRSTLLSLAGIVQTIPSLALLALMVPVLGRIGFLPAWIALTAYSVLPMLRNAITGITQVDANILEAARGVGMTERQSLVMVQLPLAAPVILAGVRTATVWVIGIATLATPVGATSLGNYIFSGLQTQRFNVVLLGCVAAAALALVMDGLIRILEIAATRRSRALGAIGVLGLLALIIGGLAPSVIKTIERGGGPRIVIGAKTFTEQHILTELIAMKLEAEGYSADRLSNLGSTIVFDALTHGRVDVYVDYTGTIWANHMKRDDVIPAEPMRAEITSWLRNEYGIEVLGALGFENAYALAMTRERAAEFGLTTFDDLARVDHELVIAGDYEFFARPEWTALVDAYGFDFRDQRSLDSTLMYQAVDQDEVDVISAFSTDGRIAAFDLALLDDTRDAFPPYEAILLLSDEASQDEALIRILQSLIGAISDELMREANRMVDLDKQSPQNAARWLAEHIDAHQPPSDASTD
jgi:osmoprotectant transport system permease protein